MWIPDFPPSAARTRATRYEVALGGPAAVAAVAASRLGGNARFVGLRGPDDAGSKLGQLLESEGVDVTLYRAVSSAQTAVCMVLVDGTGERHIFRYSEQAFPQGGATFGRDDLAGSRVVLIHPLWSEGGLQAAAVARELGVPVVLDLDHLSYATDEMLSLATHVIADAHVATELGGVAAAGQKFAQFGLWWAVTQGAGGVFHAGGRLPAIPVTVVDSTGAGDVFHGAFALSLAKGSPEAQALSFATAAAAAHVSNGAVPDMTALNEVLEEASARANPR